MKKIYLSQDLPNMVMEVLKKGVASKKKILVIMPDQEQISLLSIRLWNSRTFLPHSSTIDENTQRHPIFLHTQEIEQYKPTDIISFNKLYWEGGDQTIMCLELNKKEQILEEIASRKQEQIKIYEQNAKGWQELVHSN